MCPSRPTACAAERHSGAGVGRASVGRYQAKVRYRLTHPAQLNAQWGGRRRAAMSLEEKSEFLEPRAEQSADDGMLIVAPLRAALFRRLGRPVTHSVVYRLLARHGWLNWLRTRGIPRATRPCRRSGKRTPRNARILP